MSSQVPVRRLRITAAQIWNMLTGPSAALIGSEERARARIVSALIIAILPLVSVFALVPFVEQRRALNFVLSRDYLVIVALISTLYAASRTRYSRLVGTLYVGSMVSVTLYRVLVTGNYNELSYLAIAVLTASVMLPAREVIVWAGLCVATVVVVPPLHPDITFASIAVSTNLVAAASGVVLILVTLRKRDLQRIEAENRAAEAATIANLLKTEFLATMSHELRTPLNVIIGNSQLVMMGVTGANSETLSKMERVQRNANRLLVLIDDVLTLTRMEVGRAEVEVKPFAPAALLASAQERYGEKAAKKALIFRTMLDPNLPEMLPGDERMLDQIISNLLSNAIKFTEEGFVEVACRRVGGTQWQIAVSDSGPGIEKDSQGYIFDRFRQGDSSTRRVHNGAGLGLALVREFAQLLDGQVRVDSEVGRGSSFSVTFPLDPHGKPKHVLSDDT